MSVLAAISRVNAICRSTTLCYFGILAVVGFLALLVPAAATAGDSLWSDRFYLSGLADADEGYSLSVYQGSLVAGGAFEYADGIPAQNVASWNGSAWSGLGGGLDSSCHALITFGDSLVAGVKSNVDQPHTVVVWDGAAWQLLGTGLESSTFALAVFQDTLIAAGYYDSSRGDVATSIAKWSGTDWMPLGTGMSDAPYSGATISVLLSYGGHLIAGGAFDSADGVYARNIAAWDGATWSPLGATIVDSSSKVGALVDFNGDLIATGRFSQIGDTLVSNIARWNGSVWSSLGAGVNAEGYALAVYNGDLIAGGRFDSAGSASVHYIARWDGASWHALGSGLNEGVMALAVHDGNLIARGEFTVAGGVAVNGIAAWDGAQWSPVTARSGLGIGVSESYDERVGASVPYDGKLIVGGKFGSAGSVAVRSIAGWNGAQWSNLDLDVSPIDQAELEVMALGVFDGMLIAGGHYSYYSDPFTFVTSPFILQWSGTDWSPLGSGLATRSDYSWPRVEDVLEFAGSLIVAGEFDSAGGNPAPAIASWDGVDWTALGAGMAVEYPGAGSRPEVTVLAVYSGDLIAGGRFDTAGAVAAKGIARWDGSNWHALDSINMSYVGDLLAHDGGLLVAGCRTDTITGGCDELSVWDGATWSSFGANATGDIDQLFMYGGDLIAGGSFDSIGGIPAGGLARWDGNSWHPFGVGVYGNQGDYSVETIQSYQSSLYIGGQFLEAGGKPSANIAQWTGPPVCPIPLSGDVNASGGVTTADIIYLVNAIFKEGPDPMPCPGAGDVNCSETLTTADIIYLVNTILKDGPAPCNVCSLIPGVWSCP